MVFYLDKKNLKLRKEEVKQMEISVKFVEKVNKEFEHQSYREFISEFSKNYLELEFLEKQKQLYEYIEAYEDLENKESFHAQYLLSLIEFVKSEII